MSEENIENQNCGGARNIRDLQGLLRACVIATQNEDAPLASSFQEMDPERKEFLENAIKSMTVDIVEQLEKAVTILGDSTSTEDDKISALDVVLNFVDNIDAANDFVKVGGLNVLIPLLKSEYMAVRSKAATVIAELAQNNPYSQEKLLEVNILPKLIDLLSEPETAASGVRALSAEIRHYEPSQTAFIDMGGLECILGCIQKTEQEKLVFRSLFLMNSLCSDMDAIKDAFVKLNATETLVSILKPTSEYSDQLETTLATLNNLTDNEESAKRCRDSHLNVQSVLNEIQKLSTNNPACEEINEFSKILIKKLFM